MQGGTPLILRYDSSGSTNALSGTVTGLAGTMLDVEVVFSLETYVNGEQIFGPFPTTSTADFSDTIDYYIDSPTPGAGPVIGSTGHDYSTPSSVVTTSVPEPETWTILVGGLVIGAARRRTSTRRKTCGG